MAYKENPYSDGDAEMGREHHDPTETGKRNDDSGETAVVPKSICSGMKVGDEMVLKIVGVDEDSYEVAYAPEKGKGDKGDEMDEGQEPHEDSSMASMME